MTFDAIKVLTLFSSFYEELGRKFIPWADDAVRRCWDEISSEHDDVSLFAFVLPLFPFQMASLGPRLCRRDFSIHREDKGKSKAVNKLVNPLTFHSVAPKTITSIH